MRAWRHAIEGISKLSDVLEAELKDVHGLTIAEYSVLVHLSETEQGHMRMSDLADRAVVSRSQLTHLANRMERRRLLARHPDPDDGRGIVAALTDEGRAAIDAAAPTHVQGVRRHMIDLMTDDEVETVGRVMERIHDALTRTGQRLDSHAAR